MCSQLVTTVTESFRLSRKLSHAVGTREPKPQRIGLIERAAFEGATEDSQTLRSLRISVFLASATVSDPAIFAELRNIKLSYRILGHDFNMPLSCP